MVTRSHYRPTSDDFRSFLILAGMLPTVAKGVLQKLKVQASLTPFNAEYVFLVDSGTI